MTATTNSANIFSLDWHKFHSPELVIQVEKKLTEVTRKFFSDHKDGDPRLKKLKPIPLMRLAQMLHLFCVPILTSIKLPTTKTLFRNAYNYQGYLLTDLYVAVVLAKFPNVENKAIFASQCFKQSQAMCSIHLTSTERSNDRTHALALKKQLASYGGGDSCDCVERIRGEITDSGIVIIEGSDGSDMIFSGNKEETKGIIEDGVINTNKRMASKSPGFLGGLTNRFKDSDAPPPPPVQSAKKTVTFESTKGGGLFGFFSRNKERDVF